MCDTIMLHAVPQPRRLMTHGSVRHTRCRATVKTNRCGATAMHLYVSIHGRLTVHTRPITARASYSYLFLKKKIVPPGIASARRPDDLSLDSSLEKPTEPYFQSRTQPGTVPSSQPSSQPRTSDRQTLRPPKTYPQISDLRPQKTSCPYDKGKVGFDFDSSWFK